MRFAAIADIHGNHLALEAVLSDIRAQGISDIVDLGDMVSGPLDARPTIDMLMALDAVHLLGNHDRYLIDRPHEKMGSWERLTYTQLEPRHLDWLRTLPANSIYRDEVFLCHATPQDDETYWLETVLPGGEVCMSSLEAIEARAAGVPQSLILCAPHAHCARRAASRRPADRQSRQRRLARLSRRQTASACRGGRFARCALRDPRAGRWWLGRNLPPHPVRPRGNGGAGAPARPGRTRLGAGDGVDTVIGSS
ncbi:hypothetical protein ACVMDO_008807 [Bradyrhizobium sp. USDA 4513]